MFARSMSAKQVAKRAKFDGGMELRRATVLISSLEALWKDLFASFFRLKTYFTGEQSTTKAARSLAREKTRDLLTEVKELFLTCMHGGTLDACTADVSIFAEGDLVRFFKGLRVRYGKIVACGKEGRVWHYAVKFVGKAEPEQHVGADHLSLDRDHLG